MSSPTSARPIFATLDLYCDRVASAVGRLSVRVFGMERGRRHRSSRIISAARCSSPTSCATSTRTPRSAGSICRARRSTPPASTTHDPAQVLAHPRARRGLRAGRRARAQEHFARGRRDHGAQRRAGSVRAPRIMGDGLSARCSNELIARGFAAPRARGAARAASAFSGSSCATRSSDGSHRPRHRRRARRPCRRGAARADAARASSCTRRPGRPAAAAAPITTPRSDMMIDNGNHLLLSGNHAALRLSRRRSAPRDRLVGPPTREFPVRRSRHRRALDAARSTTAAFRGGSSTQAAACRARALRDYLALARLLRPPAGKPIGEVDRLQRAALRPPDAAAAARRAQHRAARRLGAARGGGHARDAGGRRPAPAGR